MTVTDGVRRFLVSGPDDKLTRFHLSVAMRLHGIDRREQTVFYTCLEDDVDLALRTADRCDVTVQEILDSPDGEEIYPLRRTGSHGLRWVRPSERDLAAAAAARDR